MLKSFQPFFPYSYRKFYTIHFGTGSLQCGSTTPGIIKENKFNFGESTVKLSFTALYYCLLTEDEMSLSMQPKKPEAVVAVILMSNETEQPLIHSSVTVSHLKAQSKWLTDGGKEDTFM